MPRFYSRRVDAAALIGGVCTWYAHACGACPAHLRQWVVDVLDPFISMPSSTARPSSATMVEQAKSMGPAILLTSDMQLPLASQQYPWLLSSTTALVGRAQAIPTSDRYSDDNLPVAGTGAAHRQQDPCTCRSPQRSSRPGGLGSTLCSFGLLVRGLLRNVVVVPTGVQ
eukprot:TRINITY_DN53130_c0_g1_i1.p2 TRINITY_DN53130_c0_g1~~TRINITY_DN53130_c0_g1_i1.p2  ORF type:complete len:176 (+),score=4.05 TRINITY_DN53130_c0_g1_i1:22-528(+)